MNFSVTILNQSMETEQHFVTQILIVLLFTWKPKIFFEDISNDVERWFDTSNYDKNDKRPLPIGKNKKVPGLFKDELGGKIITEVVALRPKTYAYLMDDGSDHKKAKGTKKCVIKQKLMFENYKDCLFNNKTVYRSQERFKSYYHVMYTEEVNKIALSSNDDKRLQTFDGITTYPYGTNEMMKKQSQNIKMINFDDYVNENKTEHNKNWPYIPDHPYRILIIGGSGSGKTNLLLNLIENQPDIDKIYLYAKDPYEAKYQYLIKIREKVSIDHHNDPRTYIEYSNDIHDAYKTIDEYNPNKDNKNLIVFDMIADIINNTNLNSIVTELSIRGRKLNISLVFITQSYFKVPKDVRLNTSHFFIAKIPNKRELQQIAINHSSDIRTKDFTNIYKECTAEPYSFLVNDTTLASNNPLRFRKNLFNIYNKNHDN